MVRRAKTGINQFVPITNRHLISALRSFVLHHRHKRPKFVFPYAYRALSSVLRDLISFFSLENCGYTLHSLRHGGATSAYLNGVPFADIAFRGRWASHGTCKRYLDAQRGALIRVSMSSYSKTLVRRWSAQFKDASVGGRRN